MRVIAGELGGRRLHAPPGRGTRPTSDRVREALFAALGSMDGLNVVDLYAGSGALAIEALSRGACHAILVERDRTALAVIARNLRELGLAARATVVHRPVERCRGALMGRDSADQAAADLVLVDPPYADAADGRMARALASLLVDPVLVAEGATVVVEHGARDSAPALEHAQLERSRRYGDTTLSFYRVVRRSEGPAAVPAD
jgi:16S rRNA (guanine966-N2)-methyltransferase